MILEAVKAIALLGAVGVVCFFVGFRLGRTVEFYYLKSSDHRRELDEP